MNRCLYNLELLILATARTPWQDYNEPIKPESPANYVRQLKGTDVDTIMICPTAWKRPLWRSKVDPHWDEEADKIPQPHFTADLKFHEKAYFRLREFIKAGNDPVQTAVDTAKEIGIEPFISYRMNDHHYLTQEDAFIHPDFWKKNPQFWIGDGDRHFSYINPEVRDYYFSLLEELTANYDIAGLELDLMRTPKYFHPDDIEKGRPIMTEFVRRIRTMLDKYGEERGKRLKLCVRVPHTVEWAKSIGLEVGQWDELGLIDMVNVSSFFISTPQVDAEGYKAWIKNSPCYGEIHFILDKGQIYNGFCNNVARKMTKEMYRGLAAAYLDRGLDGISFFNIDYTRHHFFNEPRRLHLKDGQPPLAAFKGITDKEALAKHDKHYFVGPNYSVLPMNNYLDLDMYIADKNPADDFKHSILRIKTKNPCQPLEIAAQFNGVELEEISWLGELFAPTSNEALPNREFVKYYNVPVKLIKYGYNKITAVNRSDDPTLWDKLATYDMVELALYKNNSFMD
ncbi:MAG: hypothetical protein IJ300_01165 [Clostridia bacterium]|nr:hypothetical protein [Clostridia bacterium]